MSISLFVGRKVEWSERSVVPSINVDVYFTAGATHSDSDSVAADAIKDGSSMVV